jgi:hypothetical protein
MVSGTNFQNGFCVQDLDMGPQETMANVQHNLQKMYVFVLDLILYM